MKTSIKIWRPAALAAGVFVGAWVTTLAAPVPAAKAKPDATATNATATAPAPFEPPQSVFASNPTDPGFGRDPFFPNSPRNAQWGPPPKKEVINVKPPPVTNSGNNTVVKPPPPPPPPEREVKLDLSGIGGRKTAVINNITFLIGEKGTLRLADGPVQIRLDEIMSDSVKVTIWLNDDKTVQRDIPLGEK